MDLYIRDQGFTGTGNLAVRREVLDEAGPFAGIEVAEDRDWGRRARARGYRIIYVPEMRIWHPAREDFAGLETVAAVLDGKRRRPLCWRTPAELLITAQSESVATAG